MSLRPQTSIPSVPDETARVTEQMDMTTPHGELLFDIFGSLAQYERTFTRERVVAGLVDAKRRGRKGGYPPCSTRTRWSRSSRRWTPQGAVLARLDTLASVGRTGPTGYAPPETVPRKSAP